MVIWSVSREVCARTRGGSAQLPTMGMQRYCLVALIFGCVSLTAASPLQDDEKVRFRVIVSSSGNEAVPPDRLQDAAIVALSAKMPESVVDANADLTLFVLPNCLDTHGPWVECSFRLELVVVGFDVSPFRNAADLTLWSDAYVFRRRKVDALSRARELLDEALDEPVATWRRLSEESRRCWTEYFQSPRLKVSPCYGED